MGHLPMKWQLLTNTTSGTSHSAPSVAKTKGSVLTSIACTTQKQNHWFAAQTKRGYEECKRMGYSCDNREMWNREACEGLRCWCCLCGFLGSSYPQTLEDAADRDPYRTPKEPKPFNHLTNFPYNKPFMK